MVETIRLESGHTLTGIVGSNPTLSAISKASGEVTLLNSARKPQLAPALSRAANFSASMATRASAFAGFAM